jgi:hypothetical protein
LWIKGNRAALQIQRGSAVFDPEWPQALRQIGMRLPCAGVLDWRKIGFDLGDGFDETVELKEAWRQ